MTDETTAVLNDAAARETYAAVMRRTRRNRKFFFATVLSYLPAVFIAYSISPTNRVMGSLFGVWVVILLVVTFRTALCRCPRCGNFFHMNGMTLLVLRRCLHCQLHINDDTAAVPEPPADPAK